MDSEEFKSIYNTLRDLEERPLKEDDLELYKHLKKAFHKYIEREIEQEPKNERRIGFISEEETEMKSYTKKKGKGSKKK